MISGDDVHGSCSLSVDIADQGTPQEKPGNEDDLQDWKHLVRCYTGLSVE